MERCGIGVKSQKPVVEQQETGDETYLGHEVSKGPFPSVQFQHFDPSENLSDNHRQ